MQPAQMQFTTAPGKGCKGCLFEHERSPVCHEVARVALRAGLKDCEYESIIYVVKVVDDRQISLIDGEENDNGH